MSTPITTVIFDVGGVLLHEVDRTPRETAAQKLGVSYDALNQAVFNHPLGHRATIGEITTPQIWQAIGESFQLSPSETAALEQEFLGGNQIDTALVDFARSLRGTYKTAILSNAWDDLREVILHKWQIADAFDEIIVSAEVGCAKPDPQIYALTLQTLGVNPEEAVFIDDLEPNILAARQAGMSGILFHNREQVLQELKEILKR
jgi:putative hydrolase of the HAD superfamily